MPLASWPPNISTLCQHILGCWQPFMSWGGSVLLCVACTSPGSTATKPLEGWCGHVSDQAQALQAVKNQVFLCVDCPGAKGAFGVPDWARWDARGEPQTVSLLPSNQNFISLDKAVFWVCEGISHYNTRAKVLSACVCAESALNTRWGQSWRVLFWQHQKVTLPTANWNLVRKKSVKDNK